MSTTDISGIPDIQSSDSLPGKVEVRKLRLHCLMRDGDSNVRRLLQLEQPGRASLFRVSALLVSRMEAVGGELGEGREGGTERKNVGM